MRIHIVSLLFVFQAAAMAEGWSPELLTRIVQRIQTRGDSRLDILVLSGGGEYGAYGAGFLRGWKSRRDDAMPTFDIVTGVSTGAILAPFAFAGTAKALEQIGTEYTSGAAGVKPKLDWLFFLKRSGGLLDRSKLEQAVAKTLDANLAAQLEQGFREKRILWTGTTNFNSGLGQVWDVEREMKGAAGLARYQRIVVASTAIPGAFAPVQLDGSPHGDGGIVSNTLLGADLSDFRRLAERLRSAGVKTPVQVNLWVVVNKPIFPAAEKLNEHSPEAVRDRGTRLLFGLKELMTLTRYWELAEAVTGTVPGLQMSFRYTGVPAELSTHVSLLRLVDPELMKRLDQAGYERARGKQPWDAMPLSPYSPIP